MINREMLAFIDDFNSNINASFGVVSIRLKSLLEIMKSLCIKVIVSFLISNFTPIWIGTGTLRNLNNVETTIRNFTITGTAVMTNYIDQNLFIRLK